MKKAYLLAFSDSLGTQEQVKQWLNELPQVTNWRYDMPHCFYLISETTAEQIADALRERAATKGRFIVSEITSNNNGWLPAKTWHLINNKVPQPENDAK